MPFTPLHMGPGILLKTFMRASFSLMIFGWSQIVMDVQPLVVLLTGRSHLHGFTHAYIGASFLAVLSALSGKYLTEFALRLFYRIQFLPVRWRVAFASAAIGSFSHVILDSIIHADLEPFWPFSKANALLGAISIDGLNWLCIGSGLVGAVLYFVLCAKPVRRNQQLPW